MSHVQPQADPPPPSSRAITGGEKSWTRRDTYLQNTNLKITAKPFKLLELALYTALCEKTKIGLH